MRGKKVCWSEVEALPATLSEYEHERAILFISGFGKLKALPVIVLFPVIDRNPVDIEAALPTLDRSSLEFRETMGKQYNKTEKRRRRERYNERLKELAKSKAVSAKPKPRKPAKKKTEASTSPVVALPEPSSTVD